MSTLTPNYGLHLPENADSMDDFFTNYESDMTTIDDHLGSGGGATIEEMTQAEYEALPDTKLTDGILRGLKDVKSFLDADILYLGTCYSTSERMVGCWVDGKPLYTRTFALPSPINVSPSSWDSMGVTVADGENVVFCWGIATDGTGSPLMGYFDSNVLMCQTPRNNNPSYSIQYLIVQYTKTTDTAGSGTWTPSGVNAVHYDTNEQVIGTWIDGKPLYEKTVHVANTQDSFSDYVTIETLTNLKLSVSADFTARRYISGTGEFFMNGNGTSRAEQNDTYYVGVRVFNQNLQYMIGGYGAQITDLWITVRYTKTTD